VQMYPERKCMSNRTPLSSGYLIIAPFPNTPYNLG
jgi:hypothetical protein